MTTDFSTDDLPAEVRETTKEVLAGDQLSKSDLLHTADWWCRYTEADNVVTALCIKELSTMLDAPTPHHLEELRDARDLAIYHLKVEHPALVPSE